MSHANSPNTSSEIHNNIADVVRKTFANKLLLIFFINFISYPSDCLDEVNTQLFSQILDVGINNTFIPIKVIAPQLVQKVLSGQNTSLLG